MSKLTYYPTMFHTNPFTFNMTELWDRSENDAMELVLNNSKAKEIGVAKIMLSVIRFSIFDKKGNEYFQSGFPNRVELNSKGVDTEFLVNIINTLKLKKGSYTTFRFYLCNTGNSFIYDNWSKEDIFHLNHMDFEIWGGLQTEGNEELQVRMRFDFEPFSLKSYFRSLKNIFNKSKPQAGKLVNC